MFRTLDWGQIKREIEFVSSDELKEMWRIRTEKNKPGQISTFNDKQLKSLRKVLKRLDDGKQLDDFILLYNITDEKKVK